MSLFGDVSSVDTLSSFEVARPFDYCAPIAKKGHFIARMRVFEQKCKLVVLDAPNAVEIARELVQFDGALSCWGDLHGVAATKRRYLVALFGV